MSTLRIFVSHSHEDDAFCRTLVAALRGASTDVWYDEHNLGSGQLLDVIQRELASRPIFIIILSPDALRSTWVKNEAKWAFNLLQRDSMRNILPVTARAIQFTDFPDWLFLEDFKRIEAANYQPFPPDVAAQRVLHALQLVPDDGTTSTSVSDESLEDLHMQFVSLYNQQRDYEALGVLEKILARSPQNARAWLNKAAIFVRLRRPQEAIQAADQALDYHLEQQYMALVWINKSAALLQLGYGKEAFACANYAVSLDPNHPMAWTNLSGALLWLNRIQEVLSAVDKALSLDPNNAIAWNTRASALLRLQQNNEALAAADRALQLDPNLYSAWVNRSAVLVRTNRNDEALAAADQAIALNPNSSVAWANRSGALINLRRYAEAAGAADRALQLDPNNTVAQSNRVKAYHHLQR